MYACRFFPPGKIFCSAIFDFHFRENPRFRDEFLGLNDLLYQNLAKIKYYRSNLSELDTNKKQNKNNQAKCWFIGPYRIVSWHQEQKAWPDTLIFRMQSLTDISNSWILPKTNLFLLSVSLPTISRTFICFSRMRQFPTQMFSRLLQVQYERKRFTNSWWAAFPVKSFKAAVINFKFVEHSWCNYKMAAHPPSLQVTIGLLPFFVVSVNHSNTTCTDWWWPKQNRFTPFENVLYKNEIKARGKLSKSDLENISHVKYTL